MDYQEIIDTAEDCLDNIRTPNEICHYTTISALNSIANSCFQKGGLNCINFWFTNAFNTNDKHELLSGFDFMMKSFSDIEETIESSDNKYRISGVSKDLIQSTKYKSITLESIKTWLIGYEATPYIMSLTSLVDNITMWNTYYGDNGKGVCLLFDFKDMDRIQSDFTIHGPLKIIYGDRMGYLYQRNLLQQMIFKVYFDYVRDVVKLSNIDKIIDMKIQAMDQVCGIVSSFIKGEEWCHEKEIRMAALRNFISNTPPKIVESQANKEHINIEIPVSCIKKIIIGPRAESNDISRVKMNAHELGIDTDRLIISVKPLK